MSMSSVSLPPHPTLRFDENVNKSAKTSEAPQGPLQCGWSPYMDNGGTLCGIAGRNFAVLGADTRTSQGYSILTRYQPKWLKLTSTTVLCSGGMRADIQGLWNVMKWYVTDYTFNHKREPSTAALAQQLSNVLFSRRFFPYYALNILAGLDDQGQGMICSYDAVGSYEPVTYGASGAASAMIMPILDNALGGDLLTPTDKSVDECAELCYASLAAAGEREITVGDSADLVLITKEGVKVVNRPLKQF